MSPAPSPPLSNGAAVNPDLGIGGALMPADVDLLVERLSRVETQMNFLVTEV